MPSPKKSDSGTHFRLISPHPPSSDEETSQSRQTQNETGSESFERQDTERSSTAESFTDANVASAMYGTTIGAMLAGTALMICGAAHCEQRRVVEAQISHAEPGENVEGFRRFLEEVKDDQMLWTSLVKPIFSVEELAKITSKIIFIEGTAAVLEATFPGYVERMIAIGSFPFTAISSTRNMDHTTACSRAEGHATAARNRIPGGDRATASSSDPNVDPTYLLTFLDPTTISNRTPNTGAAAASNRTPNANTTAPSIDTAEGDLRNTGTESPEEISKDAERLLGIISRAGGRMVTDVALFCIGPRPLAEMVRIMDPELPAEIKRLAPPSAVVELIRALGFPRVTDIAARIRSACIAKISRPAEALEFATTKTALVAAAAKAILARKREAEQSTSSAQASTIAATAERSEENAESAALTIGLTQSAASSAAESQLSQGTDPTTSTAGPTESNDTPGNEHPTTQSPQVPPDRNVPSL